MGAPLTNKFIMTRVRDLDTAACHSSTQDEECGVIKRNPGTNIRTRWHLEEDQWDICIDTIDFDDFELDYKGSATDGWYETGLLHFSDVDKQLLVDFKLASGCYRYCSNEGSGASVVGLLATDVDGKSRLLRVRDATDGDEREELWASTHSQNPSPDCTLLEALDENPNFECNVVTNHHEETPAPATPSEQEDSPSPSSHHKRHHAPSSSVSSASTMEMNGAFALIGLTVLTMTLL